MKDVLRWALLASLCACGPDDVVVAGRRAEAIVGGQVSTREAVFMLEWEVLGIPNMCSATLIGPRTLLTAAHCLDTSVYPLGNATRLARGDGGERARSPDVGPHPRPRAADAPRVAVGRQRE
jgi:hypothetical protein